MPSTSAPSERQYFPAHYYDGKTAVRHDVRVLLRTTALDISNQDGLFLNQWRYDEISFADESSGGVRVAKTGTEARLVIQDRAIYRILQEVAPNILTAKKQARRWMLASIVATIAILAAFYFSAPFLTQAIVAVTPMSFEERIGENLATTIQEAFSSDKGTCDTASGVEALDAMVGELARYSEPIGTYKVEVLDTSLVNAMALPGGYIFVFRGLLRNAQSPDEIVGVLAHEMAHADYRHPMQGMVRQYGTDALTSMMFGGSSLASVSEALMLTSYSREAEQDADDRAFETLQRGGLSTRGMADFFARLKKREDKTGLALPAFLSTHPDSGDRSRRARLHDMGGRSIISDAQWNALKSICGE